MVLFRKVVLKTDGKNRTIISLTLVIIYKCFQLFWLKSSIPPVHLNFKPTKPTIQPYIFPNQLQAIGDIRTKIKMFSPSDNETYGIQNKSL